MTVFDAIIKFEGVACPECRSMAVVHFNNDTLFTPFNGFIPEHNKSKDCCMKFYKKLNEYVHLRVEGTISSAVLLEKLNKYKLRS